jgi:peptidoglycan hydrolase-like protein with peptidoglycan-binding domain
VVDQQVIIAQQFINSYNVSGIPKVEENGKTSWTVMYALTRCLQHELGITTLSDNFGPTTLSTLQAKFPVINAATNHLYIYRILQSALYCKGYDGGDIDGTYNARMASGVVKAKQNMGVAGIYPGDGVYPKVFKALLTMDAYVLLEGGTEQIRTAQQWLNSRYIGRKNFSIMPCDGNFSRDVQKALVYGIQFELGMSDDVATGAIGSLTETGLKNHVLAQGATGTWVNLFSAAMIFNRRGGAAFSDTFSAALSAAVGDFQSFMRLPATGKGDFQTWLSLLVSHGDTSRRGAASDTVTRITDTNALSLVNAGVKIVGRYLSNAPHSTLDKNLHEGELALMARYGLAAFPIYQTYGGEASYFTYQAGVADALNAIERARHFGFKAGTRIYFGVDFDALDYQVTDNVIPHFQGIKATMNAHAHEYAVGVYGPRNVCSRIGAAGLTTASFVSDMSSGYSGNLGYTMPADWAFDQIVTFTAGSGDGAIEIDSDIVSGRDNGQTSFNPEVADWALDVSFDDTQRAAMSADISAYFDTVAHGSTIWNTTQSIDLMFKYDWLTTRLARVFRMRKALINCSLLWEIRNLSAADLVADEQVISYYQTGVGLRNDCSTGLAQIFAKTAINARNLGITQGVISGTIMDITKEADLWAVWQQLNSGDDQTFNISTIPLVHNWGANALGIPQPNLNSTDDETHQIITRYNGTNAAAIEYGNIGIGLYRIFEKYYAPMRGM